MRSLKPNPNKRKRDIGPNDSILSKLKLSIALQFFTSNTNCNIRGYHSTQVSIVCNATLEVIDCTNSCKSL